MKIALGLALSVLASTALQAAQPAATDAEPAVITSPAAATPGRAAPTPAAPGASNPGSAAPGAVAPTTSPTATPSTATPAGVSPATAAPAGTPARGNADRIELNATQITGNAELPRVMYVVPWKRAELGDLAGRPAKSLLDEVLTPVDRDVFRRQNRYYEALRPDAANGAPEGEK